MAHPNSIPKFLIIRNISVDCDTDASAVWTPKKYGFTQYITNEKII